VTKTARRRVAYRRDGGRRHRIRAPFGARVIGYWRGLGPGLVTGASENDPSGITTYSVAGATTGYQLLWLAVVTMPLLVAVQSMAARIGAVKDEGLGKVVEGRYGRPVLLVAVIVLLIANTATIAADLAGIGAGVALLVPVPVKLVIPLAAIGLLAVEVFWSYRRFATLIKWLTLVLFLYILSGFASHPDWSEAIRSTLVPHLSFDTKTLAAVVAILGTTISPYMFFWIASQEAEEEDEARAAPGNGRGRTDAEAEHDRRVDVVTGMGYANLVFYFIVLANAATLGAKHIRIETASQAAAALTPIVGRLDTVAFAVGLIGAGMIAVPVLAGSAAYPVAELFGWREGLDNPLRRAPGFYAVMSGAVILGMIANFLGIDPIQGLVYAAVLQGILAPALLLLLTLLARDRRVMGSQRNGWFDTVFGFAAAGVMTAAAIALLVSYLIR
jgi:NRAMP (natural resistance-associated macrophage protein)-like metal ion transporter